MLAGDEYDDDDVVVDVGDVANDDEPLSPGFSIESE